MRVQRGSASAPGPPSKPERAGKVVEAAICFVEHGGTFDYMNGVRVEAVPIVEFCELVSAIEAYKVAREVRRLEVT